MSSDVKRNGEDYLILTKILHAVELLLADFYGAAGIAGAYKRSFFAQTQCAGGSQAAVAAMRTRVDRYHGGILYRVKCRT